MSRLGRSGSLLLSSSSCRICPLLVHGDLRTGMWSAFVTCGFVSRPDVGAGLDCGTRRGGGSSRYWRNAHVSHTRAVTDCGAFRCFRAGSTGYFSLAPGYLWDISVHVLNEIGFPCDHMTLDHQIAWSNGCLGLHSAVFGADTGLRHDLWPAYDRRTVARCPKASAALVNRLVLTPTKVVSPCLKVATPAHIQRISPPSPADRSSKALPGRSQ